MQMKWPVTSSRPWCNISQSRRAQRRGSASLARNAMKLQCCKCCAQVVVHFLEFCPSIAYCGASSQGYSKAVKELMKEASLPKVLPKPKFRYDGMQHNRSTARLARLRFQLQYAAKTKLMISAIDLRTACLTLTIIYLRARNGNEM